MPKPILIIALLVALGSALATQLSLWREQSVHQSGQSSGVLQALMGDSRRLFANHFLTKADVYLHSGVYPSIFDQARRAKTLSAAKEKAKSLENGGDHVSHDEAAEAEDCDHDHACEHGEAGKKDAHDEHDAVTGLYSAPKDWIEAFGRNFYPTKHVHLEGQREQKEILPWLRLAAELNPNEVETYTVGAYWMRVKMGKPKEAEEFLREGLRANPDSYEILFELARLYEVAPGETSRAQNLYETALKKWQKTEAAKTEGERDDLTYMQIAGRLAHMEEEAGHIKAAVSYLTMLREISPSPQAVQKQIDELTARETSAAQ